MLRSLATGLDLLRQRQYEAAIPILEALCQPHATVSAGDRVRAMMGLVQAYAAIGQTDAAIQHCKTLRHHAHPQVQQWAQQRWRVLQRQAEQQAAQTQTEDVTEDIADILPQAHDAVARQDWQDAIYLLEQALNPETPTPKETAPYQILLIEAYIGKGDRLAAIALCKALKTSPDPVVQSWVGQTLKQLQPAVHPPQSHPSQSPSQSQTSPRKPQTPSPWLQKQWVMLAISGLFLWGLWSQLRLGLHLARLLPTPPPKPGEVLEAPIVGGMNTDRAFPAPYRHPIGVPDALINRAIRNLTPATTAPSRVAVQASEQYYEIQGQTAYQLWEAIGHQAQYIVNSGGQGSHAIASAALKPRWSFTTQRTLSHCWISAVEIEMEVVYTYPRWINAAAGNAELQAAWAQYRQFLTRHEQGHTQIAVEALSQVEAKILALGARADCPTIVQAARQVALQLWEDSSQTQTQYDENENDPDQYILRNLAVQERYQEQEAWWRGF
ncbi:MAG: DUF922 domain-containing protein [Cyanobacteria bacterium P01_G01_bin.54]